MKTVALGSQGLQCGAMGLGCMGMSTAYLKEGETVDTNEITALFKRCAELGVTLLNTCEFYGADRANERLIGGTIAFSPDSFQIALKIGAVGDIDGGLQMDSTPARIKESVNAALRLLGVPCIDLIVQARQDPNTPIADVMNCFKELVQAGKVKYVGLSEVGPSLIREAHAIHPLTAVEQEWSLWSRDIERSIVPVCRELGIGVCAYSPLGRGFLTGALTKESINELGASDFRRVAQPRLQGEALDSNLALVEHVKSLAESKGCSAAQVSLAWLYKQAADLGVSMVAIPGTKRMKYLEANVAALDVELTGEDMALLNSVFSEEAVVGDRYPVKSLMFTDE
eukprot:jgi/Ulvmu1/11382/UM075_0044.1